MLKVQTMDKEFLIEKIKLFLQISIFTVSLIITILETLEYVEKSDFNNLFKFLFILAYFKSILRAS